MKRWMWGVLATTSVMGLAVLINAIGIALLGGLAGWTQWLHGHAGHFMAWRLALYALTAWGWWRMRARLSHSSDRAKSTRKALLQAEIAAVLLIAICEFNALVQLLP